MQVKIKLKHPDAKMPTYAHASDACFDLYAATDGVAAHGPEDKAYAYVEYDTGVIFEIPEDHVGLVFPRSSISKTTLSLSNAVGVVDSSYRGTVTARFRLDAIVARDPSVKGIVAYRKGDRIAQMMIIPRPKVELIDIGDQEFADTDRGTGSYGSSGA